MVKRAAFTLIELIFAIVIIAISVMSLPMMTQVISQGIENNIVQEAIFAAATELNEVTTAHWDENSLSGSTFAKVIDGHTSNCENNSSSERYRLMGGHIAQPLHRRCLDSNTTSPSYSSATAVDALEDFAHTSQNIFIDTTTDDTGYKQTYNSTVTVSANANFNGVNPDIKMIKVDVTNSAGDTIVSLRTYSANIGEVDFYKKEY